MSDESKRDPAFPLPHILQPGEILEAHAAVEDAIIAVTNHRVIVAEGERTVLDIPFSGLRRIQFDIERGRVASMVIVPEHPRDEPRVVSIPGARLRDAAIALAVIAERLNPSDATEETG